ncbi:hypothetical protein [Dokdonella sp.]|uniref:hypothetical protein n=1 Tax=Dokdonella sp. TaxID=2291710 RepID=UPI0025BAF434|nr:hypothetical protein [Dokdonella sp.]MBX3693019.1 hypothetical protein [Dokdonella sp.]MCW5568146.1 hypothetical protein [Dokdonella sp.]
MPQPDAVTVATPVPSASETAGLRLAYAGRLRVRERKWHAPQVAPRTIGVLVFLAVLANIAWIVALDHVMVVAPHGDSRDAILVTIIEPVEPLPIPDEPQPAVFARKPSRIVVQPPEAKLKPPPLQSEESSTTSARIGAAGTPAPQLFNPDGSLRMPEVETRIGPERIDNPQEAGKARWAEIAQRGENPLDCQRTRFAGAFRADQSVGDAFAGKYLSWIGLADGEAIAERKRQRAQRAADGCDPPPQD